jgi:hypothetical protein
MKGKKGNNTQIIDRGILVKKVDRRACLFVSLLFISFIIIPFASSKPEDNPFNKLWEQILGLDTRVEALENNPNLSPLKFYHFTEKTDILINSMEIEEIAAFTLCPLNPSNNRIWDMEFQYKFKSDSPVRYDATIIVEIFDDKGSSIGVMTSDDFFPGLEWDSSIIRGARARARVSRNQDKYTIKRFVNPRAPPGIDRKITITNLDLVINTLEGI